MTCIVGVVNGGSVTLGGDSAGTSGWEITLRRDPKVFRVGEFVLGFTTSFRMGQLLQFKLEPPPIPEGVDLLAYMVTEFIDHVRDVFRVGGYAKDKEGREQAGSFLVGVRGRLFRIDEDYQVGESLDGYDAVGCGEAYAKGVLHVTASWNLPDRVERALRAAAYHSAGVAEPFNYVKTP